MKLGIIRCQQTEHLCPGFKCLQGAQHHKFSFEQFEDEDIDIIGMVSCGGCPGKNVNARAAEMVKRGADTIALASCISKGTPIGQACPFAAQLKKHVEKQLEEVNGRFIPFTHV